MIFSFSPLARLLIGIGGALLAHGVQGLFSAGEMAHVNADPFRLQEAAARGVRGAARAAALAAAPERLLAASLLGSGLSISLATFLWGLAFRHAGLSHLAVAAAAIPMALATELLAKGFARSRPETLAPLLSGPLSLLGGLGAPFYKLARRLRERRHAPRRAELLLILRERAPAGSESLAQLFTALRLSRLTLSRAARPLSHLAALPEEATVSALRALHSAHTRVALLDARGRPGGLVITVKAALGRSPGEPLAPLAQPALRLPESLPLSDAIEQLRASGQEFVLLTRGAAITGFTTQYDCARLLLREMPRE